MASVSLAFRTFAGMNGRLACVANDFEMGEPVVPVPPTLRFDGVISDCAPFSNDRHCRRTNNRVVYQLNLHNSMTENEPARTLTARDVQTVRTATRAMMQPESRTTTTTLMLKST